MSHTTSFTFSTRLSSLMRAEASVVADGLADSEVKKKARLAVSLRYTSSSVGFLHANLVGIDDEYFIVAGPSGVGKSSYAAHLQKTLGARVVANDWVAIEREGSHLYASDLNFADDIRHQKRCLLKGVIFLTSHADTYGRDAFVPNSAELKRLLHETFDTASKEEADVLEAFWLENCSQLSCCAVPARANTEAYTATTLQRVVARMIGHEPKIEVGVIGVGAVGSELAFQLGQLDFVGKVHLFNRTHNKATGYALDMNHAIMPGEAGPVFVAHDNPEAVFRNASVVFLVFRDEGAAPLLELPERWQKLAAHLFIMKTYAQMASESNFAGTLFVMTNPVDILTYACYAHSRAQQTALRTFQIFGLGLELEAARAVAYSHQVGADLQLSDVTVYGNHTDDFVLSAALEAKQLAGLSKAVKQASQEVRSYVPRTIYGPVAAAVRTLRAYTYDGSTYATVIQNGAYMGRSVTFKGGLPMLDADPKSSEYKRILKSNQQMIADYEHLL